MEALLFVLFCFAVIGGLLLIFRVTEFSRTLQILEVEVKDLRRRLDTLSETLRQEHAPAAAPSPAVRLTEEMLVIEHQVEMARSTTAAPPPPPPPLEPKPAVPVQPPPPPAEPPKPSRTREEWEQLIGGKLLNRIGALALIIGVGFFLKYAFDNNWLSESVRVLIGGVAGLGLIGGAAYFRKKGLPIFAQGLVGAGIAILYLSAYASFNFYHLVAQPTAFVLMAAVTVIAFTQAFLYDSVAVSLLGWTGGFLTPFLLSTGQANEAGLFTYIALLDAGLVVVIIRKQSWQILLPLTAVATYLVYLLWYQEFYRPEAAGLTLFFVALLWLLFLTLDVFGRPRPTRGARALHELAGAANALFLLIGGLAALSESNRSLFGTAVACMALGYGLATFMAARAVPDERVRFSRLLLTAIVLAMIAVPVEYHGYTIVTVWAIAAAAVLWSSSRWKVKGLTTMAIVIYAATVVVVMATPATYWTDPDKFTFILNRRLAGLALLALSLAFAPGVLKRLAAAWHGWADLFRYAWAATLFLLLTSEINDLFRQLHAGAAGGAEQTALSFQHFLTLAGVWTLGGLALALFGTRRALFAVRSSGGAMLVVAMGMLGATVLGTTLPGGLLSFVNLRVLVALVTAGVALYFARSLPFTDTLRAFWHYTAYILLFFLLKAEFGDWLGIKAAAASGEEAWHLEYLTWMLLACVWALYGLTLTYVGRRTGRIEPVWAGIASLAIAFLTACVQGIAYNPVTWFTPVLNARFASLAVVTASLAAGGWAAGALEGNAFRRVRRASTYVALFLLLLLLTAETRDLFERLIVLAGREGATAPDGEISRLENLKQLSLSGIWLLYAVGLMGVGLLRRNRPLRLTAIALLGFTILKIFLYDLSFLETLYRIFSFIGLGIILLAASYAYQRNKELILGRPEEKVPTV